MTNYNGQTRIEKSKRCIIAQTEKSSATFYYLTRVLFCFLTILQLCSSTSRRGERILRPNRMQNKQWRLASIHEHLTVHFEGY